jgi:hypothetical protein
MPGGQAPPPFQRLTGILDLATLLAGAAHAEAAAGMGLDVRELAPEPERHTSRGENALAARAERRGRTLLARPERRGRTVGPEAAVCAQSSSGRKTPVATQALQMALAELRSPSGSACRRFG